MKISVVAFIFLFLVASVALPVTDAFGFVSSTCCPRYTRKAFSKDHVKNYFSTSGTCPLPALVFVLQNGSSACANPAEEWVADIVRSFRG